jgi:hypothetical protein
VGRGGSSSQSVGNNQRSKEDAFFSFLWSGWGFGFLLATYSYKGGEQLLYYNIAKGKNMLRMAKPKANIVEKRWTKLLPSNYKLR